MSRRGSWVRPLPPLLRAAVVSAALPLSLGAQTVKEDGQLEKCDRAFGRLAVYEPSDELLQAFRSYQLESPTALLKMFAKSSGCFRVVERGVTFQGMERERALAERGQLQGGSNVGGGQIAAADFFLTPNVKFSNPNAGGVGAGIIGGVIRRAPLIGGLGAGLKFKDAETTLTLADTRTSEMIDAAEGRAKKTDFSLGMLGIVGGGLVGVGGYTNTAEGKIIAASFLDNYNKLVQKLKANPEMQQRIAAGGAGATAPKAGAVFSDGDLVGPRLDGVKLLAGPSDGARVLGVMKRGDQMIATGEEQGGFVKVSHPSGDGWVRKTFVAKQ